MTIVSTESRLGMTAAQMPRVNLMPPEIAERAKMRKVQTGLGAALVASVGVVGLLAMSAAHGVSAAQGSLDAQTAKGASLQAQTAKYASVTAVYSAAAAAQGQLVIAMGPEVRYSQLLHDLSLTVPSTVWLKNLSYTQAVPAAAAGTVTGTAGAPAAAAPTALGTMSVTGVGFDHDDLARWLQSLSGAKNYANVYFSNSTEALLGTRKVVNFTSTADLTQAALSGRYTKPLGN